jgi:prepilin peptidase dependent protein B
MLIVRQRLVSTLRQRGMSIIELMVGVALGLIVVAGAVKLMGDTLGSNRRVLLETRVNQDLRTAADLIARDIRRAGYWNNAQSGIFTTTGAAVSPNPYAAISLNSNVVEYQYARDADDTVQDAERAGFRLQGDALEFRNGEGGWQLVTDPGVVRITTLSITPSEREVELHTYCSCLIKLTCSESEFQAGGKYYAPTDPSIPRRPTSTIRQFAIVLAGEAANDASVRREIRETVRVRNDRLDGRCPSV